MAPVAGPRINAGMVRKLVMERSSKSDRGFRWRGTDVARIEGLSDGVFGFAVTLLIVSLEVPKTFDELTATMRGFFGFAVTFYLLMRIWYMQYRFFRRYGLHDRVTIVLNAALLFVVLFYTYPLKFLASLLLGGARSTAIQPSQWWALLVIYGAGYGLITVLFILLDLNALRQREHLELTEREAFETRHTIRIGAGHLCVALLSIAVAIVCRPLDSRAGLFAGLTYFLIYPVGVLIGIADARRRRALFAPAATEAVAR